MTITIRPKIELEIPDNTVVVSNEVDYITLAYMEDKNNVRVFTADTENCLDGIPQNIDEWSVFHKDELKELLKLFKK